MKNVSYSLGKTMRLDFNFIAAIFLTLSLSLTGTSSVFSAHAKNAEELQTEQIQTYDSSSRIAINYDKWTSILRSTILEARMSSRIYAQKPKAGLGTKVNLSNNNPTRLEASRVFYHLLEKKDIEYIHSMRLAMEALPQLTPLQSLNRNEQLAYWLNLYNITVYEQIAQRYPIRKLKELYKGSRKTPSMWDDKILNVNGVPLSLNDIHYNIIQKTWKDPVIIYGLYQGAIGGPNLYREAYTGNEVYAQLKDNAKEFVNSLRGLRFKGGVAQVSVIYEWNRGLFPNFQHDLRQHLRQYTNFELTTRLDRSRKIKAKNYDWYIADLINGGYSPTNKSVSTNPAGMLIWGDWRNLPYTDKAWDTAAMKLRLPNDTVFFLKDFLKYNYKNVKPNVTIEEIDRKDLKKEIEPIEIKKDN